MDVTGKIARFAAEARYENIPARAVETAKIAVMDCVGVALAGSREPSARICAELARFDREESTVIGQHFRSGAIQAALVNGTAAHALDFDHSFALMGQPTAPLIPAILALGEATGASGRRIVEAYAAGFETVAKLALSLREGTESGWHAPGGLGSLGAAVACARLLDLDAPRIATAVGIAASMAGGLVCNFGTMTKPLHAGLGARNGVMAAKLAQSGFTANDRAIEAKLGFYRVLYAGVNADGAPIDELGRKYELVESGLRIKPYPCGGLTHPAIDALLELRARHGLAAAEIEAIEVGVTRYTFERIAFGVPETGLQGKFSMPYVLARAIIDGGVFLDAFTDEAVRDPDVLRLAERIRMTHDRELRATSPGGRPCRVSVRLRDGRTLAQSVEHARGSREAPMSTAELERKFMDCARRVIDEDAARRALECIDHLETMEDIRPFCSLLRG
ncbi:MAG TPA: MmgE/PrpD family protein [candidate division Zixibacteria bacterium]|nr:MmgE/PrpD family protein [candidate division Zixibacteria bacterium]